MTDKGRIRVKIKDAAQFQTVFPLPVDCRQDLGQFLKSIVGKVITVRPVPSCRGRSRTVFLTGEEWVVMPNWIEWFETAEMVSSDTTGDCQVLIVDGVLIVVSV